MFGYHYGVQSSTKYYPYMTLIGRTLRLIVDNNISNMVEVVDDQLKP